MCPVCNTHTYTHTQYMNVSFAESEDRSVAEAPSRTTIAQFLWAQYVQITVLGPALCSPEFGDLWVLVSGLPLITSEFHY